MDGWVGKVWCGMVVVGWSVECWIVHHVTGWKGKCSDGSVVPEGSVVFV